MLGFCRAGSIIGVRTQPGATVLTRPLGAIFTISFFKVIVSPYIIAFDSGPEFYQQSS